jgi:hypothetical protein
MSALVPGMGRRSLDPLGALDARLGKHRQVVRASLRERLATLDRRPERADDREPWTASKTW